MWYPFGLRPSHADNVVVWFLDRRLRKGNCWPRYRQKYGCVAHCCSCPRYECSSLPGGPPPTISSNQNHITTRWKTGRRHLSHTPSQGPALCQRVQSCVQGRGSTFICRRVCPMGTVFQEDMAALGIDMMRRGDQT